MTANAGTMPSDLEVVRTLQQMTHESRSPEADADARRRMLVERALAPPVGVTALEGLQHSLDLRG